jgi:hypothetical protein
MMGTLTQLVITVYILANHPHAPHKHLVPLTYTLPEIMTKDKCFAKAEYLATHYLTKRRGTTFECIPTDKRES